MKTSATKEEAELNNLRYNPKRGLKRGVGISMLSTSFYNTAREPVVEVTEFGTFQYVRRTQVPLHSPLLEYLHWTVRGLFCTFFDVLFFVD